MGGVSGEELLYAIKKAFVWNTAVFCGLGDGLLARPASIKQSQELLIDDSCGIAFAPDGTPGDITVDGDLPLYLRYDGLDVLLALAMGSAGTPAQQSTTIAYAYAYALAGNTDGLFCTFVKDMKNYVAEVAALKIVGFTIKGEAGKPVEMVFKTIGSNVSKNTASGTNSPSTIGSVTIPPVGIGNRVMFSQAVFRINNQSAIALAAGDTVKPSAFEFSFMRKLSGVSGGYTTGLSGNNQGLIDEPTNDGIPEISLKLTFPRHSSVTRLSDLGGDTRKKMDITFTGGLIAATYYRTFKIEAPHLQYKDVPVTDAAGIIQEPVEFILHAATVAPAGMVGITQPFKITGINQRSSDPLTDVLALASVYPLPGSADIAGTNATVMAPPITITFNHPKTLEVGEIWIARTRWTSPTTPVNTTDILVSFPTVDNLTFELPTTYYSSYDAAHLTTYTVNILKSVLPYGCPAGMTDTGTAYSFSFTAAL